MLLTLCGHGHVVKVMVVWFIPGLKVPLGNMCQAVPTDVSAGQERNQVLPFKHLLLVLEVCEVARRAAHELKAREELVLHEEVQECIQVGEVV